MNDREEPRLEPRDRELVAWMRRHYQPPEEAAARRAGFLEALRARIEPRRSRALAPALVAAVATACLAWWLLPVGTPSAPGGSAELAAWEEEVLLSSDVSPAADRDESRYLPDDYQAIAAVFLES